MIISGLMAVAIASVGFVIRITAREALNGFKESLKQHASAIKELTDEVKEMRNEMSDMRARLSVVEVQQKNGD